MVFTKKKPFHKFSKFHGDQHFRNQNNLTGCTGCAPELDCVHCAWQLARLESVGLSWKLSLRKLG